MSGLFRERHPDIRRGCVPTIVTVAAMVAVLLLIRWVVIALGWGAP